ncbi:MAG TPA: response regulator transcription factor [Candidatus Dormibacteraeota bacterium]|nr:response regulator transcription factor [Candidatus Dormibacteraeota bacterium]
MARIVSTPVSNGAVEPSAPMRIAIVDNHQVASDGLKMLVDDQSDMDVVGVAASVAEAAALPPDLAPEIVLIDQHLPDGSGRAAADAVRGMYPEARLIFVSSDESDEAVAEAVAAGASAFVPKSRAASEFIDAIRKVAGGISLLTPTIVADVLVAARKRDEIRGRITERELKVLELLNEGLSSRDIAGRLGISYSTVRSHIRAIAAKLQSHSKLGAIAAARDLDLVS